MAMPAYLPSPPISSFHVGPLDVHFYALAYLVGIALAIMLTRYRWRAVGGDPELVGEIALWVVPAGIIGGRIYFDVTTPMDIPHVWYGPFAVWSGGLGIWGGVLVGGLVGVWRLHRRGVSPALFADAMAPGLLMAQGIGRIGNYFNKELFGRPTSLPWGLEIPYSYRVQGGIPAADLHFATFQPTFLYELIFDFAWAGVLIWLGHRYKMQAAGPVRPVRVRLLRLPDLRGVAAHRLLGLHPRAAAEHVHRLRADRVRRGLVLPQPAPSAARAGRGPAVVPKGTTTSRETGPRLRRRRAGHVFDVSPDGAWDWWRAQRPPAELLHLDTAAAGRSSTATLAATAAHAGREATRGAYVAQAEAAERARRRPGRAGRAARRPGRRPGLHRGRGIGAERPARGLAAARG